MTARSSRWLDPETLKVLHDEQIADHGGLSEDALAEWLRARVLPA